MPFLIAIVGAAVAFYFFVIRARNAANIATDLADMANDVRLAARRFGFRQQTNVHPVESIDKPELAIMAAAQSFMELGDLPTKEQRDALLVHCRSTFNTSEKDASEMIVLGRWLMTECGSPEAAVSRITRKLYKLDGNDGFEPLMTMIKAGLPPEGLSEKQRDSLDDIKRAFRIR